MNKILFQILLVVTPLLGLAQAPSNDECQFATHLGAIFEYCSEISEFTTQGATLSPEAQPFCWFTDHNHDVWFTFTPTAPASFVQLFGAVDGAGGNVPNPSLAIYSGNCNNLTEIGCGSVSQGTNIVELTVSDLIIGQTYYIRVDARNDNEGTFHLCIESFIPTASPESDCPDAIVLCDKTGFIIDFLDTPGDIPDEMTGPCIDQSGATLVRNFRIYFIAKQS